jgi:hypothetical protein
MPDPRQGTRSVYSMSSLQSVAATPAKKRTFCIYSLPRSGSTWLSVFMSGRDSFCYHEPLSDYSLPELLERIGNRHETAVGIIDTAAYRASPRAAEYFERQFVLLRDADDIRSSSARFGVSYDVGLEMERLRASIPKATAIEYESLWDVSYLRNLWVQAIGTEFDEERARLMIEMRIERDIGQFFANRPQLRVA